MKKVLLLALTIFIALAATTYGLSASWGKIGRRDRILYSERIYNLSTTNGVSRNVQFPTNNNSNKKKITAVQVLDNSVNITNSYPTLFAGGPGFKYLTINFMAGTRGNLDYQLVIYGKK